MVYYPLSMMISIGILQNVMMHTNKVFDFYVPSKMKTFIQRNLIEKYNEIGLIQLDNDQTHDLFHQAKSNADKLYDFLHTLFGTIQLVIGLGSFLVYVYTLSPLLTLITTASLFVYALVNYVHGTLEHRYFHNNTQTGRKANYLTELMTSREYLKEVKLFQSGDYILKRWREIAVSLSDGFLKIRRKQTFFNIIVALVGLSGIAFIFVRTGLSVKNGEIGAASFAGLAAFIGQLGFMVSGVGLQVRGLITNHKYAGYINEFLSLPHKLNQTKSTNSSRVMEGRKLGGISLKNISLRYMSDSRKALDEVNIDIEPGQLVAIVGENGAGKTSLASIISGLYESTEGDIYLDGQHIRTYDPQSLRTYFGLVFQKPLQLELSIRENITLGEEIDEQLLKEIIEKVDLESAVAMLPNGLDTPLGKSFSKHELSGGCWQKIAIARCFVRERQAYILDEPTSALDPKVESTVYRLLRELSSGKTTIIISHRLGWLKNADKIVVMKDGRIVETGTHKQLITLKGEYSRLYQTQARWYQEGERYDKQSSYLQQS